MLKGEARPLADAMISPVVVSYNATGGGVD